MHKMRIQLLISAALAMMMSIGCSTIQADDSINQYKELKRVSVASTTGMNEGTVQRELNEHSTLQDYLAYAALYNPELEAAFNRWKAALEKISQVRSLPDPRFTYAYYIENVETRVGPQRHRIDLSQTFPWFGKLGLQGDIALEETHIQKQAYERLKLNLFYRVKVAYYEYYLLSRSISITEENLRLLSYFENVARTQYESGKATIADVIKAQVELGKLEERLLSLQDLQKPMIARLNGVLNRPYSAQAPWPSSLPIYDITPADEDIIKEALESNPDLKTIDIEVEKEVKAIDLAKKQFYPDMMLGLSYIETGHSSMPDINESGKDPIIAMFSINLPLWRNKYRAGVREAELRQKTALKERKNRENMLITDMKTALYNLHDAGRKIALYKDALIPKAKQSLNVTQTAFESGKKDFLSLVDTQRTLLELELAYERALVNYVKFRAQVEMLVGRDFNTP